MNQFKNIAWLLIIISAVIALGYITLVIFRTLILIGIIVIIWFGLKNIKKPKI